MIWIGMIVCFAIVSAVIYCRNYEKEKIEQLDKSKHKLRLIYPVCLYLFMVSEHLLGQQSKERSQEVKRQLQALDVSVDKEESFLWYRCRKMSVAVAVIFCSACFCILSEATADTAHYLLEGRYLVREEAGGGAKEIPLSVTIDNLAEDTIQIVLGERTYTKEEKKQKLEDAKQYVAEHYLGENSGNNQVVTKLNLIHTIPDNCIVVNWNTGMSGLVEEDGSLHNETVKNKKMETTLTAEFCYETSEEEETLEEVEYPITILEQSYSQKEQIINELEQYIQTENEQHGDKKELVLPAKVGNYTLHYKEIVEKGSNMLLILGVIVAVLLYFMADKDLNSRMEKRKTQMLMDYPELMNKFTLLLGAGMTVRHAWGRIAAEYEEKKKGNGQLRYAYEEWMLTWNEMNNGVSEAAALENFGRRAGLAPYLKFSTLLAQNLKKGSKGLLELLEFEAMDAFEERKEAAKRLGEEAGTKLLLPMMIMLLIVMVIVMYPAFCTMAM